MGFMLQVSVAETSEPSAQLQILGRDPLRIAQAEPPSCGSMFVEATGIAVTIAAKAAPNVNTATKERVIAVYGKNISYQPR